MAVPPAHLQRRSRRPRYEPDHLRIGSLDLSDRRTYYLVCLAALVTIVLMANRLRRSGVGRALVAVRDNEPSAAAYTIAPGDEAVGLRPRRRAGGVRRRAMMALVTNARADQFPVDMSLSVISMAVIGGLASVSGAVIGTLWVVGLPAIFGTNETVGLLTSGVGLLVLIMYFPGGLVQVAYAIRGAIVRRSIAAELAPRPRRPRPVRLAAVRGDEARSTNRDHGRPPDLVVRGLGVTFGGRRVVDGVDLHVDRNEVVGLIGANGAGKTTIMNAIGGFVPADGRVELLGHDIGSLSAARRRARPRPLVPGRPPVRRPDRARDRGGRPRAGAADPDARGARRHPHWRRRDREQLAPRPRARRLPRSRRLRRPLRRHAVHRHPPHLRAGRASSPSSPGVCLDEPTAGVAQRETEAFAPLITRIRRELGASLLVIEHDMPFVMSISDRCTASRPARSSPRAPRPGAPRPQVVASYLGTDERTIRRSGAAARRPPPPARLRPPPPPERCRAKGGAVPAEEPLTAIRSVRTGDVSLEIAEAGAGGRPLLMVHGFTGAKEDFADF